MHATQRHYIEARALFDVMKDVYDQRLDALAETLGDDHDDEAVEAFDLADEQLRAELGIDHLEIALREAEDLMIDWSITVLKSQLADNPSLAEGLRGITEGRKHWKYRPRVVDLAARLAA